MSQIVSFLDTVSATNHAYHLPRYHALSPDSTTIAIWHFLLTRYGTTPMLETYRVSSDGFPLNSLFTNENVDGSTEGGQGEDWHPTQKLLVIQKGAT